MKILITIESEDNAKQIVDQSLRFVGRLGYEFKLFVPRRQRHKYKEAILDANYHWYLAMDAKETLITKQTVGEYLAAHQPDLVIRFPHDFQIPEDAFEDTIVSFLYQVGLARTELAENPRKRKVKLATGIYLERLTK